MYLYATSAGFEIGRVSRNGSVLSSISSRINAVAFTRVTKIRTTCRNNGIIRFWNRMVSNVTTRAAARESVRIRGTNARRPVAIARRVVRRYRRVRPVTTHAFRKDPVQSIQSPDEIPEHGIEAVVRTLETAYVELRVRDDLRELSVERVRLACADEERVGGWELEGDEVLHARKGLGELRALAHPSTVAPGRPVRRARKADDLQGRGGFLSRFRRWHSIESQERLHELLPREPPVEMILFRTISEAPLQGDVVPRVFPEQRDLALVRVKLADEEFEERALASSVRPDEAGDPLAERCGERIETEHLAIPLRDADGLHHAVHPVITSTAFIRTYVTSAARTVTPSKIARATAQSIPVLDAPNAAVATAT